MKEYFARIFNFFGLGNYVIVCAKKSLPYTWYHSSKRITKEYNGCTFDDEDIHYHIIVEYKEKTDWS